MADKDNFRPDPMDEEQRKFDPYAHCVTVISENHRLIHDGMFYAVSQRDAALANAGSIEVLISVPAFTFPHLQSLFLNADAGGWEIELFEGTTTSADGTVMTPVNRNRNSTNVMATVFTHTPTITGDGTSIEFHLIPRGSRLQSGILWDERDLGEFVLAPSTKYLLRVTNTSGQARDVQIIMSGYELAYDL